MNIKNEFESFSTILIKLQFLETLIKLFISLLDNEVKTKYKIKNLNSKDILEDTDRSKKTLGQLMQILKKEIKTFDNGEFQELLSKRNIFIHRFHKEYLSINAKQGKDLTPFINRLSKLIEKYTKVIIGLISISIKTKSKNQVSTEGIEKNEEGLFKYILEQNKKIT